MTKVLDVESATRHLSRDPVLRGLIDRYGLVTHPPSGDPFRDLAWAIVSQQLSSKAAASIWQRFELKFGGKCPDPAKVAAVSVEELRAIGLSGPKAAYTIDLATKFCDGVVVAAELPFLEDEEIAERLLSIKGIGKWSVDMFLMFGLNRPDVLPVGDLGIKRAFFNLFGLEGLPHPDQMEKLAEPWRPWRTVASWYLWKSLEGSQ